MRLYTLTKTGRKVSPSIGGEEGRVVEFLEKNGTATEDELDVVGGRYTVRRLVKGGIVKELTSASA